MKFTILQSNFQKALNQVNRVVGVRTTLPVLSNVLISAEKGKIKLSATDLEVAITTQTSGKIEEEGTLTIPARLLTDFIANNNDESVEFNTTDNKLHLKSAHYSANINGVSSEEFPSIPTLSKEIFCSLPRTDFVEGLKKVLISPANDETRPVLAGIYFHFNENILTLAATDSYRLSEKKITLDSPVADKTFIVPARTMIEVSRLAGGVENIDKINIFFAENQISFVLGETQIVSRLIEGSFPPYSQIIPATSKIKVEVSLKELVSAVKMSALFAKNAANNIKIKTGENALSISSAMSEAGDAVSQIEAKVTGGEVEIAFNSKYLIDVLQIISDDKVTLEFNDSASAGVIRSAGDANFVYIAMPLRIDK